MTISPAEQKILDAAIIHFADKGFDAGSLNTIAERVGIRKATIYFHFKKKKDLFSCIKGSHELRKYLR
ncbi:TetR/AcrR family transcriptional regulator [Serratia marcescens]